MSKVKLAALMSAPLNDPLTLPTWAVIAGLRADDMAKAAG